MRNNFPKRRLSAPLHTLSKLYDISVGFCGPPPLVWGSVLLYFAVAEGWLSSSDDLSYMCKAEGHWCSGLGIGWSKRSGVRLLFSPLRFQRLVISCFDVAEISLKRCNIIPQKKKGRDLTQSYDKSPYTNRNDKRAKWQHKQCHKKGSITQRLRTDLGRSVGVHMATQPVWLTWFTDQTFPTPQQPCNQ